MPFRGNPRPSLLAQAPVFFVSAVACLALVHCDKAKEQAATVKLGEPVGVRVDDVKNPAGQTVGSLSGAFAITQGQAPEPLVPGMARVLDRIGKNCPALFAKGNEPLHVRGKVSGGALAFAAAPDEGPDDKCFREAMNGQKISETPMESDIAVELRPEAGKK